MEMTVLAMNNAETPAIAAANVVEPLMELVTLDDAKLRQVGGGVIMTVQF